MPTNVLIPRFGGPMGRHARPTGVWFNPVLWVGVVGALVFGAGCVVAGRAGSLHLLAAGVGAMVVAGVHLLLGRDSDNGRRASWDAVFVACSPAILLGTVGLELVGAAFVAGALLAWTHRRLDVAGLLLGVGGAFFGYPWVVVFGVLLACVRAGRFAEARRLGLWTIGGFTASAAGWLVLDARRWAHWWIGLVAAVPEPGSVAYVLQLAGLQPRSVGIAALLFGVLGYFALRRWAWRSAVPPRVGQLVFLIVALVVLVAPGYSSAQAVWLWPLLVLARPRIDLVWFALAEAGFFAARLAYEAGYLTIDGYGAERLYWAATLLRLAVLVLVCVRVVVDVRRPWRDALRIPVQGDPIAGPLADDQAATGSA